jgi:hypothetical protein
MPLRCIRIPGDIPSPEIKAWRIPRHFDSLKLFPARVSAIAE